MEEILEISKSELGRTCDFSYGGILMWKDIFDYGYCIINNTLFIKGVDVEDMESVAFSLPVGEMKLEECLKYLAEWCRERECKLVLSAVPEHAVESLRELGARKITELVGWADYLYDINSLASLSGKKMAKKRNHVNQFLCMYGSDCYERINDCNIDDVREFMIELEETPASSADAAMERRMAMKALESWDSEKGFYKGGLLRVGGVVVAFTIGDIKCDTLFIHIEKANREIAGSYEMINKCFAADMLREFPNLKYVNREDDSGEEGLRRAKMSYHPVELLRKYTVKF